MLELECFAPLESGERDDDHGDGHEQQLRASHRLDGVSETGVTASDAWSARHHLVRYPPDGRARPKGWKKENQRPELDRRPMKGKCDELECAIDPLSRAARLGGPRQLGVWIRDECGDHTV